MTPSCTCAGDAGALPPAFGPCRAGPDLLQAPAVPVLPGQPMAAVRQHGVFTAAQAAAEGRTRRDRIAIVTAGHWVSLLPGVFHHRDLAPTPWTSAQAAVLGGYPDRVVSHNTAAALWQVAIRDNPGLHTIRRNGLSAPGLTEHRLRLAPDEVIHAGGIRLTDRQRTMVDLLCADRAEHSVDWLVAEFRAGRITAVDLDRFERRIHGRTGAKRARELLASCRGLPYSKLEWFFHRIAWAISDTGWTFNHPVSDGRGPIGCVDALHEPSALVVELDGKRFHGDDRFQADRTRDQRLAALGFRVLRFTWEDVTAHAGWVTNAVRRLIATPHADRGSLELP